MKKKPRWPDYEVIMTSGDSIKVTRSLFQVGEGSAILTSPHQLEINHVGRGEAEYCYEKWHYLGKTGFMSTYNFGVYFDGDLVGCISYGVPNAKEIDGMYKKYEQKGWWEIKRFALSPICPKNSESRMISVSIKILKKLAYVKGIVTYADSSVGHTGIIYKASGFKYLGLTEQKTDLFIDGIKVGKKGQYRRAKEGEKEEWIKRSRKHLFVKK